MSPKPSLRITMSRGILHARFAFVDPIHHSDFQSTRFRPRFLFVYPYFFCHAFTKKVKRSNFQSKVRIQLCDVKLSAFERITVHTARSCDGGGKKSEFRMKHLVRRRPCEVCFVTDHLAPRAEASNTCIICSAVIVYAMIAPEA